MTVTGSILCPLIGVGVTTILLHNTTYYYLVKGRVSKLRFPLICRLPLYGSRIADLYTAVLFERFLVLG